MPATIAELLLDARRRLAAAPFEAPQREAQLLLGAALGLSEAQLIARDQEPAQSEGAARFAGWLERRLRGEPVAYLLGRREFYGRDFAVDRRVLVPRPETEHLVEAALTLPVPTDARVLDVGAGSGAIAVTLAAERPDWTVLATERSLAALAVARTNAARWAADVRLLAADLTAGLALHALDLVVSNPPYVALVDRPGLSREIVDFEPAAALFAGDDGLEVYRRLLPQLRALRPGAVALLELGAGQRAAVAGLADEAGFDTRAVIADYAGIERVLVLERRRRPDRRGSRRRRGGVASLTGPY